MSREEKRTQYSRDFLLGIGAGTAGPPLNLGHLEMGVQEAIRGTGLPKSTEADDIRKKLKTRSSRNSNKIFINHPNVHSNQDLLADRVKMQVKVGKPEMPLWNQISWRPLIINFMCPFGVKKYVGTDEASTTKSDFIKSIEKETQKIFESVTPANFETMKKSFGYLSLSNGETKEDDLLNATVGVAFNVVLEGRTSQPDWTSVQHLHVKLLEAISKRGCFWEVSAKLKEHITLNIVKVMFQCHQEYSDLQKLEKQLLSSSSSCGSMGLGDGNNCQNGITGNDLESDDTAMRTYSKMKFRSRERSLRLMRFIASLYNSQLLIRTPCNSCQVIVDFIALHLQFPSEQNLEYICELLSLVNFPRLVSEVRTNEAPLYSLSVKGSHSANSSLLLDLLNQIHTLSLKPSVSPRVRFCVQYLMDLYKNICQEGSKSQMQKITPNLNTVSSGDNVAIGITGDQCGPVPVPLMSLSIPSPLPSCSGRKRSITSDCPKETPPLPHANINVESQVAQDLEDVFKTIVHMNKKSELKDAARRTNILLMFRVVDKKTILKLLAYEIVKQFQNPELDPPQATTNIANFLTELFCSEGSLNWLAEVGTIIEATQSLQTSSMWRVVSIHCLTNLKQMLTLTQLTDALRRTERRDLIPLPKNFAGLFHSLKMTAPKTKTENEMESLNLNEQVTPKSCNLNQNGARDMTKRRDDYLNWSDYFMGVAFLSAMRSKDPSTQVGACIVNDENKIVGIGYNGMPNGCSDDDFPWGKDSEVKPETKYMYVCHAEMNAILNKIVGRLNGCRMYVALFPCNECAKLIIQSGIKEVFYLSNKNWTKDECIASRRMLDAAGIKYSQYTPKNKRIVIDFDSIDWNKDPQLPPSPVRN